MTGVNTKNGSDVTDDGGQAVYCYSGTKVGEDAIVAYADSDNDDAGRKRAGRHRH